MSVSPPFLGYADGLLDISFIWDIVCTSTYFLYSTNELLSLCSRRCTCMGDLWPVNNRQSTYFTKVFTRLE